MRTIAADVHRRGCVAATFELLRDGHTSHDLTRAVRRSEVIRARQGHYVCVHLPEPELQAVRVGGRLTGSVGARAHGIWTMPTTPLAVLVPADARALRSAWDARARLGRTPKSRVRPEWSDRGAPGTRSLAGPLECLRVIALREPPRVAFAAAESALRGGLVTATALRRMIASLPSTRRGYLTEARGVSESGAESLLIWLLIAHGIPFVQQVVIDGVGRVDVVVADRLVIEVDGAEFHTDQASFEQDRRRDALLASRGLRVLRFSYRQLEQRPDEVLAALRAALGRGDHL